MGFFSLIPEPTTFYVSASGSDTNDGLTPDTAWATIDRANTVLPNRSIVLFRRGDTFYGQLKPPFNCEVGAYGTGDKPVLTAYKLLNQASGWIEHVAGVWKVDLTSAATHGGYTHPDTNVGYLMVDGAVKPAKKKTLAAVTTAWDFYSDATYLYVSASANPTTLASSIKAASRGKSGRVIDCSNGAQEIHDLHITGSGGHGITGAGANVHVHHCLIDYIGGSYLPGYGDGQVRYGNGIENWIGAKAWLVEDNEIAQCYDVAYTCQGTHSGDGLSVATWEDMTIRENNIRDCNQSFEFWSDGNGSNPASGFKRILIEGNLCRRAGYSVWSDVRPDQSTRVHLLTYNWVLPADITIQNNTFEDAYGAYSYHASAPVGLITRNNTIRMKSGHKLQEQRAETVEQFAAWQLATGRETESTLIILP